VAPVLLPALTRSRSHAWRISRVDNPHALALHLPPRTLRQALVDSPSGDSRAALDAWPLPHPGPRHPPSTPDRRAAAADRASVYGLIDAARRGTVFYKFMINPDPKREDTYKDLDLEHITRQTILALERQLGVRLPFAAVLHSILQTIHPFAMCTAFSFCPDDSPKRHSVSFSRLPGPPRQPTRGCNDAHGIRCLRILVPAVLLSHGSPAGISNGHSLTA
jgi:hypothetical protein